MTRTDVLQERRMAKFLDLPDRGNRRELSVAEAGEVLGISGRQFRRFRDRLEEEGLEGLAVPPFSWAVWAHIAGGIAILALALWRVALRRSRGAPPPPEGEHSLTGRIATLSHWALYALILLLPVGGLVAWFGGVELAGEGHEVMSNLLLFVVAVHVAAALWHQFWLKDHLLRRMMRAER